MITSYGRRGTSYLVTYLDRARDALGVAAGHHFVHGGEAHVHGLRRGGYPRFGAEDALGGGFAHVLDEERRGAALWRHAELGEGQREGGDLGGDDAVCRVQRGGEAAEAGRRRLGGGGWAAEAGRRRLGGGGWAAEAGQREEAGGAPISVAVVTAAPSAGPLTAATIGFGKSMTVWKTFWLLSLR